MFTDKTHNLTAYDYEYEQEMKKYVRHVKYLGCGAEFKTYEEFIKFYADLFEITEKKLYNAIEKYYELV